MGWKDAIDYLRGAVNKNNEPVRQDEDLPLKARIGSLVSLQLSPLLRASSEGSLIALPEESDTRILAISQLKLTMEGRVYRYYLSTGDAVGSEEKFLQLYVNAQGEVLEILYCSQLVRVTPETVDDQDAYTGANGHGLGDRNYTLWKGQLEEIGVDPATVDQAFGETDAIDYQRDAGDPDEAFVRPYAGTETRLDDAAGMLGLKQQLYYMPYVRELRDGGREFLLVTTEVIQSVNGDARKRGIHVDFVVAIPVEQERLVIQ